MSTDPSRLSRIGHVILRVSDLKRSTAFYRDTLGLPLKFAFEGFAFFDAGGITLALNENQSVAGKVSELSHEIVFDTADIHAAFAALKSRGVEFTREPRIVTSDATHDLLATDFRDPDGHVLSITGRVPRSK